MNNMNINKVLYTFKSPPSEYGLIPFWFWNDDLEKDHLLYQMKEMKDKNIDEFIIHSRLYRTIAYLSEEWFDRIAFVLENAKAMDMKCWIYDEDNWPSGYAGGRVLEKDPDCYGKAVVKVKLGEKVDNPYRLIKKTDKHEYYQIRANWNPAYSDTFYTDMLNPVATELFMEYTHREYLRRFGEYFGNTIKGFFTDETGFYNNFDYYYQPKDKDSYVWTDDLPNEFLRVKGYDLLEKLDDLYTYNESSLRTRLDYYDVVVKMYIKNYFDPITHFCEQYGMQHIGHVHSEEMLPYHVKTQGDLLRVLSALSVPGIDRIDCSKEKITEKYASSAQHIYNKSRALSETFALSGRDLTLQKIKFLTNYQYVRGINMLVPHAFFSSIEGERKNESPPTLFFQNPYWKYFASYSDYAKRLAYILSQGQFHAVAALYYPITTQQELVQHNTIEKAKIHDRQFIEIGIELSNNQIDYDIVNSDALKLAKNFNKKMVINNIEYSLIIIPDVTNMPCDDLKVIEAMAASGMAVVYLGDCYFNAGCEESAKLKSNIESSKNFLGISKYLLNKTYTYYVNGESISAFCEYHGYKNIKLYEKDADIKYMHRSIDSCELLFVVNESANKKSFTLNVGFTGTVYTLNPYNGELYFEQSAVSRGNATDIDVELPEYGQALYLIDKSDKIEKSEAKHPVNRDKYTVERVLDGEWNLCCGEYSNNKTLDYWEHYGMPHYSGSIKYKTNCDVSPEEGKRYYIDLGKVYHTAEVYINDNHAGNLIWSPYMVEITDLLINGINKITVIVSNTLGNEQDHYPYPSGLIGKVRIISF